MIRSIKTLLLAAVTASGLISTAHAGMSAPEGMIVVASPHSVEGTLDKLAVVLESKGMKIMARVDHSAGAASVDLELRPTQLMIFGNPKAGTPLMQCSQSLAIDLPQKMLAWEDEAGKVWLGYNDPMFIKARHSTEGCDAAFEKVSGALANFAKAATAP